MELVWSFFFVKGTLSRKEYAVIFHLLFIIIIFHAFDNMLNQPYFTLFL